MALAGYAPGGTVETDAEVSPEARHVDIWFTPNPGLAASTFAHLGLLGRIAAQACALEACHNTPGCEEVLDDLCKLHLFRQVLARREKPPPLPAGWIVSSGKPFKAIADLRFTRSKAWGKGIYEGPRGTHTCLIAVSELPVTPDTLLVRMMGAGAVLKRAIAEMKALAEDDPRRVLALPILVELRLEVPSDPAKQTADDQEFLMQTQDIVQAWRQKAVEEGRLDGLKEGLEKGLEKGLANAVLTLYEARFGAPPPEIEAVIRKTRDQSTLLGWLKLVGTRSAEEATAALRGAGLS